MRIYKSRIELTPRQLTIIRIIIVLLFLVWIISAVKSCVSEYYNPDLTPVSEPESGQILSGYEAFRESEITVTASKGSSCLVKLKTSSGIERLSFYVRAGETVTIGVPCEYLYVYFASGETWYGEEHHFGANTSYSKDDQIADFSRYTMTYTLYPVTDGNFSQTPIDKSEFE